MSLRRSLTPDQKLAMAVALGASLLAIETVLLVRAVRNQPAVPNQTAPARNNAVTPTPTPTGAVFSVPEVAPMGTQTAIAASSTKANPRAIASNPSINDSGAPVPALLPAASSTKPVQAPTQNEARVAFEAGTAQLKAGDKAAALASFRRVVALSPNNLPTRLNLAVLYLEAKQPQNALPHLKEAARLDPKSAAVRFNLARALIALRRPKEAVPVLREVVQLAPNERDGRVFLAEALVATRREREAYTQWSFLANRDKRDVAAHLASATLANDVLKKPTEAKRWLERASVATPRDPRAPLLLSQLLMSRRQFKEADVVLTRAAKARPDVFELLPPLATARAESGNSKGAIDALRSALLRVPKGTKPAELERSRAVEGGLRVALGRLYGNQKKPKDAIREFRAAMTLRPRDPEPRSLGAIASLQLKDAGGATRLLQDAVKLDPRRDGDRKVLGRLLAEAKRFREADAQLALYSKNQPRDLEAILMRAQIAQSLKDKAGELQLVRSMTEIAPKNPFGWAQLGVLLGARGDHRGARNAFLGLTKLRPDDPNAHFELAQTQTKLGDFAGAFNSWKVVVQARPDYVPAYESLLTSADKAGQSENARSFLAREMASKKENLAALTKVLAFYEKTKRPAQARLLLTEVVKRNPKHASAQTVLKSFATAKTASSTNENAAKVAVEVVE